MYDDDWTEHDYKRPLVYSTSVQMASAATIIIPLRYNLMKPQMQFIRLLYQSRTENGIVFPFSSALGR